PFSVGISEAALHGRRAVPVGTVERGAPVDTAVCVEGERVGDVLLSGTNFDDELQRRAIYPGTTSGGNNSCLAGPNCPESSDQPGFKANPPQNPVVFARVDDTRDRGIDNIDFSAHGHGDGPTRVCDP